MAFTDHNHLLHTLPPWPQLSFALARDMLARKCHHAFLTFAESEQLKTATESYSGWLQFITTDNPESRPAACRVRTMLYEQLIPFLYPTNLRCCSDESTNLQKVTEQARSIPSYATVESTPIPTVYIPEITESTTIHKKKEEEDEAVSATPLVVSPAHEMDRVPLRDVYQTLETDHHAIVELHKAEDEETELDEKSDFQDYMLSLASDTNAGMKYLLQGIAANREKTLLTDRELRGLLSGAQPTQSKEDLYKACKKVLDDLKNFTHSTPFLTRVSKSEAPNYYEEIEKPMDLGTMTKKLRQFEYKSKDEFKNDLNLIYDNCLRYNKDPSSEYRRHANAMRRKTNRLLQNVPDISLRNRWAIDADDEGDESSDRGETPVNEYPNGSRASRERSMTRESSTAPTADSVEGLGLQMALSHHAYTGTKGPRYQPGEYASNDVDLTTIDDGDESEDDWSGLQYHTWQNLTKKTRAQLGLQVEKHDHCAFGDRPAIVRSSLDMKRFYMLERAHSSGKMQQKLVRCTYNTFARWVARGGGQGNIYDGLDIDSVDEERTDGGFFFSSGTRPKADEDEAVRADLFLPEYSFSCSVPEIPGIPEENETELLPRDVITLDGENDENNKVQAIEHSGYTNVPLDTYPSVLIPNHGLQSIIDHNIKTLADIRLLYSKCNINHNNTLISTGEPETTIRPPVSLEKTHSAGTPFPSRPEAEWHKASPPPLVIHKTSSGELLQRTLIQLLAHTGFEGAHSSAMNVLMDLFIEYILNMGKTVRAYWDDYGRQMSSEEILMHSLYENGITSIMDLELYIGYDVERHGQRLEDVKRRLRLSCQDILTRPVHGVSENGEALFDDEESFITGSFGTEVDEDFFGLKEIGLDKELDMTTFSIPAKLWFGHQRGDTKTTTIDPELLPVKYLPPPPFMPISSESGVIGLLQSSFRQKLATADDSHLAEDEFMPRQRIRPRYPPIYGKNQANVGRKKNLKESQRAVCNDSRKAKRKRSLEEIQAEKVERQRQKQEAKAQKQAEKEEKRKQREEQKEKERLAKLEAKDKKGKRIKKDGSNSTDWSSENTALSSENTALSSDEV